MNSAPHHRRSREYRPHHDGDLVASLVAFDGHTRTVLVEVVRHPDGVASMRIVFVRLRDDRRIAVTIPAWAAEKLCEAIRVGAETVRAANGPHVTHRRRPTEED